MAASVTWDTGREIFQAEPWSNFNEFLSCGIAGGLDGERYKKTPENMDESFLINPAWVKVIKADEQVISGNWFD